ncbi:hypothetical protein ACVW2K_002937 [Nocardioides sp. HB32]
MLSPGELDFVFAEGPAPERAKRSIDSGVWPRVVGTVTADLLTSARAQQNYLRPGAVDPMMLSEDEFAALLEDDLLVDGQLCLF